MMLYSFKLVDDILHIPSWIIPLMATSWQIFFAVSYLLMSMIWKNNIKYDLFFGILHVNALMMTFGVTLIFWGFYIVAQDLIIARSIGMPVLYLHLQHTLPFVSLLIDLLLFKNYNHTFRKQSYIKYLMYSSITTVTYMVMIYFIHCWRERIKPGSNFWPYPFMKGFTDVQYLLFCLVMLVAFCILCTIQRYFHSLIVKDRSNQKQKAL